MSTVEEDAISKTLNESLGEAIHTALRKASPHPEASAAYEAIRKLPPAEWRRVIQFAAFGLAPILADAIEAARPDDCFPG